MTYFALSLASAGIKANQVDGRMAGEGFSPPQIYWVKESFYAETTAYTKIETCPNKKCVAADGTMPEKLRTIACPRRYEFATKIRIDGREYRCNDRTRSDLNGRFDIYFGDTKDDYERAIKYGKQTKIIEIIKPL